MEGEFGLFGSLPKLRKPIPGCFPPAWLQMANEARPCPCDIGDRLDYGGLGHEIELEHTKAYVVKPSCASDKAIIVIQDIYGWQLPNTRYMADMLAANGYT